MNKIVIFLNKHINKFRVVILLLLISATTLSMLFEFDNNGSVTNLERMLTNLFLLCPVIIIEWFILYWNFKKIKFENRFRTIYNFSLIILTTFASLGVILMNYSYIVGFISFIIIYISFSLYTYNIFYYNKWTKSKNKFKKVFSRLFRFSILFLSSWFLVTSLLFPLSAIYIMRPSLQETSVRYTKIALNYDKFYGKVNEEKWDKNTWIKRWGFDGDKPPLNSKINFRIENNITKLYEWTPIDNPIKKKDKIVLFLHGLNGTRYTALQYMQNFHDNLGYKMLSFDMRGFGENRSMNRTFGIKEADDIANAFKVITEHYEPEDMIIYGISNGAGSLLSFATKYKKEIKEFGFEKLKLIDEAGYTSPFAEFAILSERTGIPIDLTMPQSFPLYRYLTKTSWLERDYLAESSNIKSPLLILHGTDDDIVSPIMSMALTNYLKDIVGKKNMSSYILQGYKHVEISRKNPRLFMKFVKDFLNKEYKIL